MFVVEVVLVVKKNKKMSQQVSASSPPFQNVPPIVQAYPIFTNIAPMVVPAKWVQVR